VTALISLLVALPLAAASPAQVREPSTGTLVPGRATTSPVQSTDDPNLDRWGKGGSLSGSPASLKDLQAGRIIVGCVVDSKPLIAMNYLNSFFENRRGRVTRPYQAILSTCLEKYQQDHGTGELSLALSEYTNYSLLAEAYLTKYGIPKLAPLPLQGVLESEHYERASPDYRLAACLAYTQPEASANLVASPVGSPQESVAFAALVPLIPDCVPAGSALSLDKSWVRLRLATSLYLRAPPETPRSSTTLSRGYR
jgi:hypothetical protein